ncbi:putative AMP-dependent synthetase/ligase, ANL domain-containing protein [Helianthus debilis subsp. tardiflorus]
MEKTTKDMTKVEDEDIVFRSRFPSVSIPDNVTLPEFVLKDAELYADHVAFVDATTKKSCTHGEVVRDVRRFSKGLRSLGLRTGHVVVVILPNVIEYAIVALGVMTAGGVFSGANPSSHSSEIKKQVELAEAKLIVTDERTYNKVISIYQKNILLFFYKTMPILNIALLALLS